METPSVQQIAEHPAISRACALILRTDDVTIAEQCEVTCIPAPPFGESARGAWIADRFDRTGMAAVRTDDAGNVICEIAGTRAAAAPIIVAAHLDTVFPAETPLNVRKDGHRILVPGISDNARGLAALLAIARAARECGVQPCATIMFVATVGEEGVGDLRGVKHLFGGESPLRDTAAFIALDGTDSRRIVTSAVGSVRYRITLKGPGGHAWADRGSVNAAHALGAVIANLAELRLSPRPAWTLSVGRVGGGTSINAIPEQAWLELDLRSEDADRLTVLDELALNAIREAVRGANAHRRRGTVALTVQPDRIGARPAGRTHADSILVRTAEEATRYIGRRPELVASSTDANVPMSLGIPSIAIGAGGESGGMHTAGEWYDNRRGADGIIRALLTIFTAAGVNPD